MCTCLGLEQRWAYCLDLPHPFGEGSAESHAIAVDPAGGRLTGPAALALAGTRAYVGTGTTVTVLDGTSRTRLTAPSPIRGLGLNGDASLLYLGAPTRSAGSMRSRENRGTGRPSPA
ncbi:hypothetical protein [Couchioplanes caeruleus]|uniref:Uncharacterized protein n=2 Tax=Couchioplanes caeruleus TaxID=56438 RepID=A0A1K0FQX8_9ACTN|nr:hypothetical protein [Couchioplanes caeruleus]OJF15229.1 hypothetical protein BG844_05625 [Couchioplanes caeruleus subsp. caeruleus]ROP33589.1 hypothetical protein EDD30_6594 [Couchioplanes caeruleus]